MSAKDIILGLVPKVCPACGGTVKMSEDLMHLWCENPACSGKLYRRIEIMAKAFGIENIGTKVAEELVNELGLTAEHQLFDLTIEDYLKVPRYQIGMATKLFDSVNAVKGENVNWSNFIRGIQLARVGEGTAKDMSVQYKDLDDLLAATPQTMAKRMSGMTTNLTSIICESLTQRREEILELAKRVNIVYTKQSTTAVPETSILAVVTGKLGFGSRPDFQKTFGEKYGVKWASAVSRNTDILVTNEASTSTKYREAQKIQEQGGKIKIMTEEEFIQFIGGTSVATDLLQSTASSVQQLDMFGGMGDISL